MLEARAWLFVEPVMPYVYAKKTRYITDLSPEVITCDMLDLMKVLRMEFKMPRKETDNMQDCFGSGMSLIIDLLKKLFYRDDREDAALVRKHVIRTGAKSMGKFDMAIKSKYIEKIVNSQLRNQ